MNNYEDEFLNISNQIAVLKEKISKAELTLLKKHQKNLSKVLKNFIEYKIKLEKLKRS